MSKGIWQKIKQNHLLLMIICCLVPLVLIIGLLSFFKERADSWIWLIFLLCPLMHIFMMRGHKHDKSCKHETDDENNSYKCPECRLLYKEKEWAQKCQAWCLKYKSCNLEITKHAIKKQHTKI